MTPFEGLYVKGCRSPICWDEVGERKLLGARTCATDSGKNGFDQRKTKDNSK